MEYETESKSLDFEHFMPTGEARLCRLTSAIIYLGGGGGGFWFLPVNNGVGNRFYRATQCVSAVLALDAVCPSVCLSVCPSVYQTRLSKRLVLQNFKGNSLDGDVKYTGYEKFTLFCQYLTIS